MKKNLTPEMAADAAEKVILYYAKELDLQTPEEVRQALEMLISKGAFGIKKYCGVLAVYDVLRRTIYHVLKLDGLHDDKIFQGEGSK